MSRLARYFSLLILVLSFCVPIVQAQGLPPRIFFTDLDSGPNTGGENNNGTILTIYGKRFGATRGTSTVNVGVGTVAAYLSWSDSKISVAIGPAAATGNVVVNVAGVGSSNGVSFAVRSGNIFCVSPTGLDTDTGQFGGHCWRTLLHARDVMRPGDTVYALNNVVQNTLDANGAALFITTGGTAGNSIAYVAYPGATVIIGWDVPPAGAERAVRTFGTTTPNNNNYVTFAGFRLHGTEAFILQDGTGWRLIGNDMTCPNGDGQTGCMEVDRATNAKIYGNTWHDISINNAGSVTKLYHAVYLADGSTSMNFGWNTIRNSKANRGIQVFSSTTPLFDMHIHDNLLVDIRGAGIMLDSIDPTIGVTEAYNNVIKHAGTGPDFPEGPSIWACLSNPGSAGTVAAFIEFYNNSTYDCGSISTSIDTFGAWDGPSPGQPAIARLRNNIFQVLPGELYMTTRTATSNVSCDKNLWFGIVGAAPSTCTNNVNRDPLYVDPLTANLRLQSGSPAIGVGVNTGLATDFDGVPRPPGAAFTIGAFEGVSTAVRPNPPTNLRVVVVR